MTAAAVFALSFSTLLFELSLSRWLAIAHWGHLSTLVIGIALFGSAVSGAVAARLVHRRKMDERTVFPALCLACSLATLGSFVLARIIPLDYPRFPVDRMQSLWLLSAYLDLALPFFIAGLGTCLAYVMHPEHSGRVSCAAMGGSGAGAACAALAIPLAGEGAAVALAALVPLLPAVAAVFPLPRARGAEAHTLSSCSPRTGAPQSGSPPALTIGIGAVSALAAAAIALLAFRGNAALQTTPSPYKTLPQLLMMPGTAVTARSESAWGSERVVESPRIRFAPGLSLSFAGRLPPQTGVILDGDELTAVSDLSAAGSDEYAKSTHAYAGHLISKTPASARSCLVLQRGGGLAVVAAIASGAGRILLVCDSPEAARRAAVAYRGRNVTAVAENPRAIAAGTGKRYDLIHVENWGPSVPGMASLTLDALLTVDALRAYWNRLTDGGAIAVSRKLVIPPSDSLRVFGSLLEALRRAGVPNPDGHLAVIRSWDSCTFLACREPLDERTIMTLRQWCGRMGFDLDWFPGITAADTNRFNRLEESWFFQSYAALAADPAYASKYYLDIAPQGDDRPFPSRFVRWTRIGEFVRAAGGRPYGLLLSGEIVAAAVFLETLLLGAIVLGVPLLGGGRRAPMGRSSMPRRPSAGAVLYFLFIGAGYILIEIAFLNAFTVAFASPLIALTVTLGGMLFFSGLGGLAAERLPHASLSPILLLIFFLLALAGFLLTTAARALIPLPFAARVPAAIAMLAAPSAALGIPFALAVRDLPVPQWRAVAWAANGSASVVGASAAALIGMGGGIGALSFTAAAAYLGAALAGRAGFSSQARLTRLHHKGSTKASSSCLTNPRDR